MACLGLNWREVLKQENPPRVGAFGTKHKLLSLLTYDMDLQFTKITFLIYQVGLETVVNQGQYVLLFYTF